MAEVNLHVNGKSYGISCDDGQEERVLNLGRYIDSRVREIASAGAAATESHLLVLASLLLADEVFDLKETNKKLKTVKTETVKESDFSSEEQANVKNAIARLALRIDFIAESMQDL